MPPTRRATNRAITAIVAVAASAALAACGTATAPAPGTGSEPVPGPVPAAPPPAASPTVVMVIRHAEKPEDDTKGYDAQGNEDESSLTEVGWDRANRLVDVFDGSPATPAVDRPDAIYAAHANDLGEGQRTRETVAPLAERLGVAVDTRFGKGDEEQLVEQVAARPGRTLISWSHSGIPRIAEAFAGATPEPPADWPDERFDVTWTFTRTADGWRFTQTPQLLLPEDEAAVIESEED